MKSFQILKDGSATSIYGARAMAGVGFPEACYLGEASGCGCPQADYL